MPHSFIRRCHINNSVVEYLQDEHAAPDSTSSGVWGGIKDIPMIIPPELAHTMARHFALLEGKVWDYEVVTVVSSP